MTTTILKRRLVPLLLAACFGVAVAAPTGQQVVAGQATFTQQGNVFSITNTPGTIINWQSFSVNAGEITRFIQQSSDSAVLNRIVGQDPTRILGALQSNGQVFLINPNGILFGRDSRVDVNGLVASSLNLSNADFLAGKKNFSAGAVAGEVRNEGAITTPSGGQVFLVAPNVTNAGIITSPKGDVVLAAGHSVQLVDSRDPDMQVVVSAPQDAAINLGQVVAQGGRIGIYGALVNQRGIVNANSAVVGENGKIVLKASRDTVLEQGSVTSATGAGKGGDVHLLGERVSLTGDAQVDASGALGGGSVLVGGDWQGKNAALPNARETFMDKDASIRADATASGDGGKVVLWSDASTRAFGSISAQGGQFGGNGGKIETSGHNLAVDGIRVNARAAKGKAGTWLLDPYDIEVRADGDAAVADVATTTAGTGTGVTKIKPSLLTAAGAEVVLQAQNDITITDAIDATNNVTATAGHDIYVNANVTAAGVSNADLDNSTGTIKFNATNDIKVNANVTSTTGYIQFNAGKMVDFGSGAVVKNDRDIEVIADQVNLGGTIGRLTAGSDLMVGFTTRTATLPIRIGGASDGLWLWLDPAKLAGISAADVNIGTSGSTAGISVEGAVSMPGSLSLNSSGPIAINAPVTVGSTSSFLATLWGDQGTLLDVNAAITGNSVYLKGDGLRISATITADSVRLLPHTPGTEMSLGTLTEGDFSLDQGMLSKVKASSLTIGGGVGQAAGILVSSNLDLSANPFGLLTLDAGAGDITLNGILTMPSGVLSLKSTAGITQGAGGGLKVHQLALRGQDVVLNNGDNNQIGTIAAAGTGTVFQVAGTGDMTVGQVDGLSGISAPNSDVQLTTTGKLTVANDVDAAGNVAVVEANGIDGGGKIKAGVLSLTSYAGIGSATAALNTRTGVLNVHNDQVGSAAINISNTGDLALGTAVQTGEVAANNTGAITIATTGSMTVPASTSTTSLAPSGSDSGIKTSSGAITLKSGGSMNIGGSVASDSGNIALTAGNGMIIGGTVSSTSGNISLLADKGSAFTTQSGAVVHSESGNINVVAGTGSIATGTITTGTSGKVTISIGSKPDPTPPRPSLDQCVANPNSAACGGVIDDAKRACSSNWNAGHCDDVMPKVDYCKANPTALGCTAVVKRDEVLQCAANPRGANCGDVLPKFEECQGNAGALGCDAVIKQHDEVSACVANPTAACYADVLPAFDMCAKNPATFGCSPVVKRHDDISACIVNPKAAGCSAVLPPLASCHANAGEFGCAPVLAREKFEGCVANASGPGCDSVLPPLDLCKATPGAEGCGAVIKKTFDQCLLNPNDARCTGVLPKVSECVSDKTQPGCQVVLPTMNQCIGSPTLQGCSVILPKLEQCAVNPGLTGCEAVLPNPDFCGTHPADPTCAVFVPSSGTSQGKSSTVGQSVQNVVTLLNGGTGNTQGGSVTSGHGNPAGTGTNTGTNTGTSGGDSSTEKKADKQTGPAASENSGARNEKPATKTYCN